MYLDMTKVLIVIAALICCGGIYWANKRSFDRRNQFGIEEFEGYGGVVFANLVEGVVRIASFFGLIMSVMMFFVALAFDV